MARISFTVKRTLNASVGSYLQADPDALVGDNDSALQGSGYVTIPSTGGAVTESFFDVKVVDYNETLISWGVGSTLASTLSATPQPTAVHIRYDIIGEPQTVSNGIQLAIITPDNQVSSISHTGVPEGTWVYYSIFVKYESTATDARAWFEKVASTHVLMPSRYGSTQELWNRVPRHYQIQDGFEGPLYRMLSVFGWDIDRIRTLINYQMVAKDPRLATPEVLDALAFELGVPMSSVDLGSERIRNILTDILYLRNKNGTVDGVREWLTAISGSEVVINTSHSNLLAASVSTFDNTLTTTTNELTLPTTDWVFTGTGISTAASTNGAVITRSSGTGGIVVTAKVKVANLHQGSWYKASYDVTNQSGASVLGLILSTDNIVSDSFSFNDTYILDSPYGLRTSFSDGETDWYQANVDLGMPGDGSLTNTDMYLHIFMRFSDGPSTLTLNNINVTNLDKYPYEVDVYTQRVNLFRDPQFFTGLGTYWTGAGTGGATVYATSGSLGASSSSSGASVTIATSASVGGSPTNIPVQLGVPYYMSIDDRNSSIVEVRLKSRAYGTLATATETRSETQLSGSTYRRTWVLQRPYEEPWLPLNIPDCYIEFVATTGAGASAALQFSKPLLEPLNASGVYFDGDNTNGGWLSGTTTGSGVADYRWGDAGQHISFSYFTSDYQRTEATMTRLLDTIIPVTQSTVTAADLLNMDRIYGYTGTDRP